MLIGHNVDIEHGGQTYHVQTEDRGRQEAIIETLVYIAGTILHSERTFYKDIVGDCQDSDIAALMEMQHRRILRSIRAGRFDKSPRQPFGENLLSSRSLDQIVLDFLEQGGEDTLELLLKGDVPLRKGEKTNIKIAARTSLSKRPIANAELVVNLELGEEKSVEIIRTATGPDGEVVVEVSIPVNVGKGSALVVRAQSEAGDDEVRQMIIWAKHA